MTITHTDGRLSWAWRGRSAALAHRHYDTFELPEAPGVLFPDRLALTFSADRDGDVVSLAAPFEPLVKDIVFTRVGGGESRSSPLPLAGEERARSAPGGGKSAAHEQAAPPLPLSPASAGERAAGASGANSPSESRAS
jgi:hypothetical protein